MALLDFEQIDTGLAKVAAVQKLAIMIGTRIGQHVIDIKVSNGYWQCFIPGMGWQRASEALSGRQDEKC